MSQTLTVSSNTIAKGSSIPARHSAYADGISPPLQWSAVDGARSYAVVVEDPDAKSAKPFAHWIAWNIPPTVTALPEGLKEQPDGMVQGTTDKGSVGYFGPRPPSGDPPHHYHFKVFALDSTLDLPSDADRDRLLAASKNHVIAEGELVGTYQQA